MLHKSFKPAKCKTSLKLATSRIKLMKNKKGVQINQMNKDLAHLLETAQDPTARIRVEHVIREEKMVAAYDLIEIYCELIVARLPIIESQKTCPIDLKEAVTSVIFAAPRCSDISELADIKKQFAAKYGKEFVMAALELRPDCGVSRMLVEKLSAVAPNLETKIKVLSAVAKEHNIEWDSTSFEEKEAKPSHDLLNGPPKFENAHMENTDPPKVQPSNNNAMHSHGEKPIAPADFSELNRRYTLGNQNVTSTDKSGEASSSATHADMKSSGTSSERVETTQQVHRSDVILCQVGRTGTWNLRMLLLQHMQQLNLLNEQLWLPELLPSFRVVRRGPTTILQLHIFLTTETKLVMFLTLWDLLVKIPWMIESLRYQIDTLVEVNLIPHRTLLKNLMAVI